MQLLITFEVEKNKIKLPIHYNYVVQSTIYNSLRGPISDFLHEGGFTSKSRNFKLFTFSRLMGKYKLDFNSNTITFYKEVKLLISSPIVQIMKSLFNKFIDDPYIKIKGSTLNVRDIKASYPNVQGSKIYVHTLSPVVVYTTSEIDNSKRTNYFEISKNPEYSRLITNNLRHKHKACYKEESDGFVKVIEIGKMKRSTLRYKGFIITGYSGDFTLEGNNNLLQMAVDAGLGAKNSQGFGALRVR